MTEREQKEQHLRDEMSRCILLSEEDKKFWIDHAAALPSALLDKVITVVESKNKQVDTYLEATLEDDPDHKYLSELKADIKRIKEKAFSMEEGEEKESAEDTLKKQLENL